jgi:hypothetical protein
MTLLTSYGIRASSPPLLIQNQLNYIDPVASWLGGKEASDSPSFLFKESEVSRERSKRKGRKNILERFGIESAQAVNKEEALVTFGVSAVGGRGEGMSEASILFRKER